MCAHFQSFKYLKRGEGVEKRYGRINYPILNRSSSTAKSLDNFLSRDRLGDGRFHATKAKVIMDREKSLDSGLETAAAEDKSAALDVAADRNLGIVRSIREKIPLFSPESVASSYGTKDHSINSEISSFEVYEQLAETSINSNSSVIPRVNEIIQRRHLREIENFPSHQLSTVQEAAIENSAVDLHSVAEIPKMQANFVNSKELSKSSLLHPEQDDMKSMGSGKVSNIDTRSSSSQNGFTLNVPSTLLQMLNNPFDILKDFDKQENNIQLNSRHLENDKYVQDHTRTLKHLEKRLRAKIDLLASDANLLAEMKFKIEEREKELEQEMKKLKTKTEELETRKEQGLNSLLKEHADLKREQTILAKEQNMAKRANEEMVNLLKTEIKELENRLSEKDASISANNSRINGLKSQLIRTEEELKNCRIKNDTLNNQVTQISCENAQLRTQLYKSTLKITSSATMPNIATNNNSARKAVEIQKNIEPSKSVRFNLPVETSEFKHTINRSVQTTNADETATQTSLVIENGRKIQNVRIAENRPSCSSDYEEKRFADGKIERRYNNGDEQILDADQVETHYVKIFDVTQIFRPDGSAELKDNATAWRKIVYKDGRRQICQADGTKITFFDDGKIVQEFSDGDVQTTIPGKYIENVKTNGDVKRVYSNNWQITKLINGRIRVRNAKGDVVRDEISKQNVKDLDDILKSFGVEVP